MNHMLFTRELTTPNVYFDPDELDPDDIELPADLGGPPDPDEFDPDEHREAVRRVEAVKLVIGLWLKEVGMSQTEYTMRSQREPVQTKAEWVEPIRVLMEKAGWDTSRALSLMQAARNEMLEDGLTPWRPTVIVRKVLADMARPKKQTKAEATADASRAAVEALARQGLIE